MYFMILNDLTPWEPYRSFAVYNNRCNTLSRSEKLILPIIRNNLCANDFLYVVSIAGFTGFTTD